MYDNVNLGLEVGFSYFLWAIQRLIKEAFGLYSSIMNSVIIMKYIMQTSVNFDFDL